MLCGPRKYVASFCWKSKKADAASTEPLLGLTRSLEIPSVYNTKVNKVHNFKR